MKRTIAILAWWFLISMGGENAPIKEIGPFLLRTAFITTNQLRISRAGCEPALQKVRDAGRAVLITEECYFRAEDK